MAFNHEVVPIYLRTKSEPDTEERELTLVKESSHLTPEQAQVYILKHINLRLLKFAICPRPTLNTILESGGLISFLV